MKEGRKERKKERKKELHLGLVGNMLLGLRCCEVPPIVLLSADVPAALGFRLFGYTFLAGMTGVSSQRSASISWAASHRVSF